VAPNVTAVDPLALLTQQPPTRQAPAFKIKWHRQLECDLKLGLVRFLVNKAQFVPDIHLQLGELYFQTRHYQEAFENYYKAALRDPDNYNVALRLASVSARVEKFDLASILVEALTGNPNLDEDVRKKAQRLKGILQKKGN